MYTGPVYKDSLLTRGPTFTWWTRTWWRGWGEEETAKLEQDGRRYCEDRLRSAAISLVRSRADRRAAMEFMRLGVG